VYPIQQVIRLIYKEWEVKVMRGEVGRAMRGSRERKAPKMDMAPLIDCVFLLLIFFMVATTFSPLPGIRVKLPPPGRPTQQKPKGLIVRIADPEGSEKWGTMVLNENIADWEDLKIAFQNASVEAKNMLIIQSQRDVLHEQIVMIMDLAKRAGVDKIGFAMVGRTGP
jgi:biopolymer transport protein ExbD